MWDVRDIRLALLLTSNSLINPPKGLKLQLIKASERDPLLSLIM
jgi:hypothetical protein